MNGWTVLAGTTKSHHHPDNQDSWTVAVQAERLVLVVSDGAGSASRAGEGSQRAARIATATAACGGDGAGAAQAAVEAARAELDGERDLAATIVVAVVIGDVVDVCAVGDSPAFVELDGVWHLLQTERKSEFVNETEFLTSVGSTSESWHLSGVTGVVLASDGIEHSAIGADGPELAFFGPVAARARAGTLDVTALLEWMNDSGRLDDDTTLVVAVQES